MSRDYRLRFLPDRQVVAACAAVGCEQWQYGWDTLLDERTAVGRELAALARNSGRTYREMSAPDGMTILRFEPHQRCFAEHRTKGVRALVTHGRHLVREHTSLADIAEDYTEHTGRLAELQQKG